MSTAADRRKSNPRGRGIPRLAVHSKEKVKGAASIIERTLVPIECPPGMVARTKHEIGRLPFRREHQLHSNWCWAAVATSVAQFYRPGIKWTQCAVANKDLGRKICCRKGPNRKCNVVGHLKQSLRTVRHAGKPVELKRTMAFSKIRKEIDAGRPLCARTVWRGSQMGHFLAVVGYNSDCELLSVADPFFGNSLWHYRAFRDDYRHSGQWKNSYHTRR